jgi:AmmeMemoRadiSam system protein A
MAALDPTDGASLARLAVVTVAARLRDQPVPDRIPTVSALAIDGASFVTLENDGRLLGCVGTIKAARPLYLDVIRNAQRAMRDPRLPPVTAADWPVLDVKVAVLSAPAPVSAASRDALVAALRPGIDGVLITDGTRRATFLPAVWGRLADPHEFLLALLLKGGWPEHGWPTQLAAWRYTTVEYRDLAPRGTLAEFVEEPVED